MDSATALEAAAKLVHDQYQPTGGPPRPSEWDAKYIGISTLVKQTAGEYARKIIGKTREEANEELLFYQFRGNSLGDSALRNVPNREIRVEHPISAGWKLVGHADAFLRRAGRVVCLEHKSHSNPSAAKVDLAFRQGAAYLAMMMEKRRGDFPVADFARDSDSEPFHLNELDSPAGVVVCIAPFNPPAFIQQFPTDPNQLADILQFYVAKAESILDSIHAGNPVAADKWDAEHPTEFLVPIGQVGAGIPDLEDIGQQLAVQLKILTPTGVDTTILDDAEEEVKRLRTLADLAMAKHSVRSGVFGGVRISRTVVGPKEVAASPAYVKQGYSFVKAKLAEA